MRVKVEIESDSLALTEVKPLWKGDLLYQRERDQVFFRTSVNSELTFLKADYALISALPDCEKITITVSTWCDDAWTAQFVGSFTHYDCRFDRDNCSIKVKPKNAVDKYACLTKVWDEEEQVYNAGTAVQTRAFQGTYENLIGCSTCCREEYDPSDCNQFDVDDACKEQTIVTQQSATAPFCPGGYKVQTCYHRIVGVGTPSTPPPYASGWTYMSGNNWWRCPSFQEISIGVLKTGRRFNDVLTYITSLSGCSLTVRSHFFGLNTEGHPGEAPDNMAYDYAVAYLQHLTLHQKSDVKRPDSSNPAFPTVWVMKMKDLLNDLRTMFNVYWDIVDDDLILEHITYFAGAEGADYSALKINRVFEQDDDGAPDTETWKWADDARFGTAFEGWPIIYGCGNSTKENKVTLFTTDVATVRNSQNAEDIQDKGFVLVANTLAAGQYAVISANEPLGWRDLHDNLHRYNRFFLQGSMNDEDTTFESARRTRRLTEFKVDRCCGDEFDPTKDPLTPIGRASVNQATWNLYQDKITLDLRV